MSKVKQQDIKMWESISHDLQKTIDLSLSQLKEKTIITCPPDDLDLKKNRIRTTIQDGEIFDEEEYLDVFAFMIEERVNVSLLQLSDQFAQEFGKTNDYWIQKIRKWANQFCFISKMNIWTVNGFMKNYVNYVSSPIQRDNIDQWRRKVQAYLSSHEFLIKKIKKLKIGDSPYGMDQAYVRYHKQKNLYKTYVEKVGIVKFSQNQSLGISYGEESNVTFHNRSKAEKKLFNFPNSASRNFDDIDAPQKNQKKPTITLDKYFRAKKDNQLFEQVEIPTDREQREEKQKELVRVLKNLGKNEYEMDDLRTDLRRQKQEQEDQRKIRQENEKSEEMIKTSKKANLIKRTNLQNNESQVSLPSNFTIRQFQRLDSPQYSQFPINHLLFIHDNRDFFHFAGYPIALRSIQISNPFLLYPWINYWINDQEEYEEIMAVELDDNAMDSDDSRSEDEDDEEEDEDDSIQHDETFIDNRKVIPGGDGDESNLYPEDKIEFKNQIKEDDQRWVYNFRKQLNLQRKNEEENNFFAGLKVVPFYGGELPYPIEGTDDLKTKRRQNPSKSKNILLNPIHKSDSPMEEIIQNSEEDNSTTNFNSSSRPQLILVMEPINQSAKEDAKIETSTDINGVQTTFEEKVQQQSFQNHQMKWISNRMEVQETKEYEEIKCLSSIFNPLQKQGIDKLTQNKDKFQKEYKIVVRPENRPSKLITQNRSGRKKSEQLSTKNKQSEDNKDVQI